MDLGVTMLGALGIFNFSEMNFEIHGNSTIRVRGGFGLGVYNEIRWFCDLEGLTSFSFFINIDNLPLLYGQDLPLNCDIPFFFNK